MAPEFSHQFAYGRLPLIPVRITSPESGDSTIEFCLVDTGAERTILDELVAEKLHLALGERPVMMRGLGGPAETHEGEVQLFLLGTDALSVQINVLFAPEIANTLSNLIGLDVLAHFDLGLSHGDHAVFLGRVEQP